jgi:uncharacterized glyoxalase superfamily protein PhnB
MIDPVPEDFHTITPQLVVKGVAGAIDWYTRAFGAHELLRNRAPDGTSIMHAELLLGDSRFFVVDWFPGSLSSPATLGNTAVTLHLYVRDVDAMFSRALNAGATVLMPCRRCWRSPFTASSSRGTTSRTMAHYSARELNPGVGVDPHQAADERQVRCRQEEELPRQTATLVADSPRNGLPPQPELQPELHPVFPDSCNPERPSIPSISSSERTTLTSLNAFRMAN